MAASLYAGVRWLASRDGNTCEFFEGVLWICDLGHVTDCRHPDGYGYACAAARCGVFDSPRTAVRPLRGKALLAAYALGGFESAELLAHTLGIKWSHNPNNAA